MCNGCANADCLKSSSSDSRQTSKAGLAQLGERQTEVHFTHISEGRVFDPHKPHSFFFFLPFLAFDHFGDLLDGGSVTQMKGEKAIIENKTA